MLYKRRVLGTVAYLGGVPAVLEPFCWAWGEIIAFNAQYIDTNDMYVHYDRAKESVHDAARNGLVRRMLGDWLLMFDADHAPEPDIVKRMLLVADRDSLDVLSALYQYKQEPHAPVAFLDTPNGRQQILDWEDGARAIQVHSAGAGSLFVRRRVFERIVAELKQEPFDRLGPWGEDHSFFWRLRQLGILMWLAPNVNSQHLQVRPVTMADYVRPGIPQDAPNVHQVEGLKTASASGAN